MAYTYLNQPFAATRRNSYNLLDPAFFQRHLFSRGNPEAEPSRGKGNGQRKNGVEKYFIEVIN